MRSIRRPFGTWYGISVTITWYWPCAMRSTS